MVLIDRLLSKKKDLKPNQQNAARGKKTFMKYFPSGVNHLYSYLKFYWDKGHEFREVKRHFRKKMGYELRLHDPQTFSEKITWKKIYDRNPLLPITADKFLVRFYLHQVLGKELAEKILIPLYYVSNDPINIPFDLLPDKFVVKPNHGSKMHISVNGDKEIQKHDILKSCEKWLKTDYGLYSYEWAYRNIKRQILVEEMLESMDCCLPFDYKLFCFHGKCKIIRVSENRLDSEGGASFFDPDWKQLPVSMQGYKVANRIFRRPENLEDLIHIAEKLAENFDAVRIDLYLCDTRIFFGEITHYHTSGLIRFIPETFDYQMGDYWIITPEYWKKNDNAMKIAESILDKQG
jgi:hypothetical protein